MSDIVLSGESLRKLVRSFFPGGRVIFDHNPNVAKTDGKGTVILSEPPSACSKEEYIAYIFKCWHETQHNVEGKNDWKDHPSKKTSSQFMLFMQNIVDDMMNDYINAEEYEGVFQAIGSTYEYIYKENKENYHKKGGIIEDKIIRTSLLWLISNVGEWNYYARTLPDEIEKELQKNPKELEWYIKLKEGGYAEKIQVTNKADERYKILDKILKEVFEYEEDASNTEDEEESKEDSEGDESESEGGEEGQGSSPNSGDEETGEDKGEETPKNKEESSSRESDADSSTRGDAPPIDETLKDLLPHNHCEEGEEKPYSGTLSTHSGGTWISPPLSEIVITQETELPRNWVIAHKSIAYVLGQESDSLLKNTRNLLKKKSLVKYSYKEKSGNLDKKQFYNIASYKANPEFNKIFKKPIAGLSLKGVVVCLLVDCSGSMGGEQFYTAAAAAIKMGQVLTSLNIPHSIYGFTQGYPVPKYTFHTMYILKEFNKNISEEEAKLRFSKIPYFGNNIDGESLMYSYMKLKRQKEKNKVLLVFSDGEPQGMKMPGSTMSEGHHLEKVTSFLEKEKDLTLYGIGIRSKAVQLYYKNNVVVNDLKELSDTLLNVTKQSILETE